jgi:hypothetical protein
LSDLLFLYVCALGRVTRRFLKNLHNFSKSSSNGLKVKKGQNIYNKPCFETAYLGENGINLLQHKVAQKVAISLGYFMFSKSHKEPPKVTQLAKNCPIWSLWLWV